MKGLPVALLDVACDHRSCLSPAASARSCTLKPPRLDVQAEEKHDNNMSKDKSDNNANSDNIANIRRKGNAYLGSGNGVRDSLGLVGADERVLVACAARLRAFLRYTGTGKPTPDVQALAYAVGSGRHLLDPIGLDDSHVSIRTAKTHIT